MRAKTAAVFLILTGCAGRQVGTQTDFLTQPTLIQAWPVSASALSPGATVDHHQIRCRGDLTHEAPCTDLEATPRLVPRIDQCLRPVSRRAPASLLASLNADWRRWASTGLPAPLTPLTLEGPSLVSVSLERTFLKHPEGNDCQGERRPGDPACDPSLPPGPPSVPAEERWVSLWTPEGWSPPGTPPGPFEPRTFELSWVRVGRTEITRQGNLLERTFIAEPRYGTGREGLRPGEAQLPPLPDFGTALGLLSQHTGEADLQVRAAVLTDLATAAFHLGRLDLAKDAASDLLRLIDSGGVDANRLGLGRSLDSLRELSSGGWTFSDPCRRQPPDAG